MDPLSTEKQVQSRSSGSLGNPTWNVDDFFELSEKLGSGNFATVHRAIDKRGQVFALKILNEQNVSVFEREVKTMASLDHVCICRYFGSYTFANGRLSFAMEFVDGATLRNCIRKAKRCFPESKGLDLGRQLLDAACHMHSRRVIHRDLKLDNVMMMRDGLIKVVDFGLACFDYDENEIRRQCGSPGFVAPEVILGREHPDIQNPISHSPGVPRGESLPPITTKVDLFSIGCVLYSILMGKLPFQGDSPEEILQQNIRMKLRFSRRFERLTPLTRKLILQLMMKNPANRISAREAHDLVLVAAERDEAQEESHEHARDAALAEEMAAEVAAPASLVQVRMVKTNTGRSKMQFRKCVEHRGTSPRDERKSRSTPAVKHNLSVDERSSYESLAHQVPGAAAEGTPETQLGETQPEKNMSNNSNRHQRKHEMYQQHDDERKQKLHQDHQKSETQIQKLTRKLLHECRSASASSATNLTALPPAMDDQQRFEKQTSKLSQKVVEEKPRKASDLLGRLRDKGSARSTPRSSFCSTRSEYEEDVMPSSRSQRSCSSSCSIISKVSSLMSRVSAKRHSWTTLCSNTHLQVSRITPMTSAATSPLTSGRSSPRRSFSPSTSRSPQRYASSNGNFSHANESWVHAEDDLLLDDIVRNTETAAAESHPHAPAMLSEALEKAQERPIGETSDDQAWNAPPFDSESSFSHPARRSQGYGESKEMPTPKVGEPPLTDSERQRDGGPSASSTKEGVKEVKTWSNVSNDEPIDRQSVGHISTMSDSDITFNDSDIKSTCATLGSSRDQGLMPSREPADSLMDQRRTSTPSRTEKIVQQVRSLSKGPSQYLLSGSRRRSLSARFWTDVVKFRTSSPKNEGAVDCSFSQVCVSDSSQASNVPGNKPRQSKRALTPTRDRERQTF